MTVMVNAGETNGIPCHADYHLLTEVLKGEWNFRDLVVSDWEGIKHLYTREPGGHSPKEAVRIGVMAGIDMSIGCRLIQLLRPPPRARQGKGRAPSPGSMTR